MSPLPETGYRVSGPRRLLRRLAILTVAGAVLIGILLLFTGEWPWKHPLGAASLVLYAFGCVTAFGLFGLQLLMQIEWAPLAVARVLVHEAVRRRVVLVACGLLLFLIVAIAFNLEGDHLLYHRMPAVLTYSLELTGVVLSMMTIFVACSTLATEVEEKRVYVTLTKPLRRSSFLLGKWIGILGLNAVLLLVVGGTIFACTWIQWAQATSDEEADRVQKEVLTARQSILPVPVGLEERFEQAWQKELERLEEEDRNALRRLKDDPVALERHRASVHAQQFEWWLHVAPGQEEVYHFRDLPLSGNGGARLHLDVKLRFSDRRPASDRHHWISVSVDDEVHDLAVIHKSQQFIPVSDKQLSDGEIVVRIRNKQADAPTLILTSDHGLELLFIYGSFWQNLARALLISWIKLAFLAALGLCAASFLSFPVATLAVVILGGVSASADFILEDSGGGHSHKTHSHRADVEFVERFVETVENVGKTLAGLVARFSSYSPVEQVADGRVVRWSEVRSCLLWIGVVWTGVCLIVGMFLLGRRELARVQV